MYIIRADRHRRNVLQHNATVDNGSRIGRSCRFVCLLVFGCIMFIVGLFMTVIGHILDIFP